MTLLHKRGILRKKEKKRSDFGDSKELRESSEREIKALGVFTFGGTSPKKKTSCGGG